MIIQASNLVMLCQITHILSWVNFKVQCYSCATAMGWLIVLCKSLWSSNFVASVLGVRKETRTSECFNHLAVRMS